MNHTRYLYSSLPTRSRGFQCVGCKIYVKIFVKITGEEHIIVVNTWIVVCM